MTFQIRDNLPEMDRRIYKGEIRLLIPFAGRIFRELDRLKAGSMGAKEEDSLIESRTIRKGLDHTTS